MTDAERLAARDRLLDAWLQGRLERAAVRSDWDRVRRGVRNVERRLAHVSGCRAETCTRCEQEGAGVSCAR